MQGSNSSLNGEITTLSGSIQINGGTKIDATGKTLSQICTEINALDIEGISATIKDGKFTIATENSSIPTISVSGDFARVTGLGNYAVTKGESVNNSTTETLYYIQGQVTGLVGTERVLGGSFTINGETIDVSGKTLNEIAQTISDKSAMGILSNVSASIKDGKFTITSDTDSTTISASGDFARVTGMNNYEIAKADSAMMMVTTRTSSKTLTGSEKLVGGSVKVGSTTIDVKDKTLNQVIDEINALNLYKTSATLTGGTLSVVYTSKNTITFNGDIARLTGVGTYSIAEGTNEAGKLTGSVDTREFTGDAFSGQRAGTLTFSDGKTVAITASDSLTTVLSKLNSSGLTASVDSNGKIVITNGSTDELYVKSDESGVARFYGLTTSKTRATEADAIDSGYTVIKTADDLNNIRNNLSGKYMLCADIDLSSIESWTAIGDADNAFKGTFDGNGYTISNLTINSTNLYNGLFGYTDKATIQNLTITDATVSAGSNAGILAGDITNGTLIKNCVVSGNVTSNNGSIGGVVGCNSASTVTNTYFAGTVSGLSTVGGIVGTNDSNSSITNCYATGYITSSYSDAGGIAGTNYATIDNCKAIVVANAAYYNAGGIAGRNTGTISNISANGGVETGQYAGGIAGYNEGIIENAETAAGVKANTSNAGGITGTNVSGATITNATNTGTINCNNNICGGITGTNNGTISYVINNASVKYGSSYNSTGAQITESNYGTITNAFYNSEKGTDSKGTGYTTSALTSSSTYNGWDTAVWNITSGVLPSIKTITLDESAIQTVQIDHTACSGYENAYAGNIYAQVVITGTVKASELSSEAFSGQTDGTITFSTGTTVNISATDSRDTVLQKINAAGVIAEITDDGFIRIVCANKYSAKINSDTSGFSEFYGLLSTANSYAGSTTNSNETIENKQATLTGSVDVSSMTDKEFYGQQNGSINFSNGTTVTVSSSDTRSQVISKIETAGMNVEIDTNGKIKITANGVTTLSVDSDTSGFTDFYGLKSEQMTYTGNIQTTTETVDTGEEGGSSSGGEGGSSGNPSTAPEFKIDGLITEGVSNIRLQIGIKNSEYSAIHCDTTFIFEDFSLDLSSADSSAEALKAVEALSKATTAKVALIGAYESRLESVADSNIVKAENLEATFSAVMDADVAVETQKYVKYQILQQTAQALLAQAQATHTQQVLQLIQGISM